MPVKQPQSALSKRLIPALLVLMALAMFAMIVFAVGVIAGLIQY